jgi:hypothetical protein
MDEGPKTVTNNILVQVKEDHSAIVPTKDVDGNPITLITDQGIPLIPMLLQYQKNIDPPASKDDLYKIAVRSDTVTNTRWNDTWINQTTENAKNYDITALSCMSEFKKEAFKPVIICGSGPSIKKNCLDLTSRVVFKQNLDTGKMEMMQGGGRSDLRVVSCLHNFGLFENNNIMTKDDYYLTLDAGEITISETIEGGAKKHPEEWYWERSKNRTLLAHNTAHPSLLKKWQGKILFFTTPPANEEIKKNIEEHFDVTKVPSFSVGGNALGACLYFARAILGASSIIFTGADFSFSYEHRFHGWNSPYDEKFTGLEAVTDIYGNRVYTWPSYYGFKCWLDFIACGGSGGQDHDFINATEGGILGAYPEGNIRQFRYMSLKGALAMLTCHEKIPTMTANTKTMPMVLY